MIDDDDDALRRFDPTSPAHFKDEGDGSIRMSSGALIWDEADGRWATSVYSLRLVVESGRAVSDVTNDIHTAVASASVGAIRAIERSGVRGIDVVAVPGDSDEVCASAHCHITLPAGVSKSARDKWATRISHTFEVIYS